MPDSELAQQPASTPHARASELREAGLDGGEIAETLNRKGWQPAKP